MSVIHFNLFHLKWEMGYQLSLSCIILDIQEQIMEINVIVFVCKFLKFYPKTPKRQSLVMEVVFN